MTSLNLSIFAVNNFFCVVKCSNINRITIYNTSTIPWRSDFTGKLFYKNNLKKYKIPNLKKKLNNWTNERVCLCEFHNKMFKEFRENERFLKIFFSFYLEKLIHPFHSFTKCFSDVIASCFGHGFKWKFAACKCFK